MQVSNSDVLWPPWLAGRWRSLLLACLCALMAVFAAAADSPPVPSVSAATAAQVVPAARFAKNVAIITIETGDAPIDWTTAYSVKRRIKLAEEAGAEAIVFKLDTPGGELGAVLEICQAIKSSSIKNSVAWIAPRAYSGGAVIALACREIVAEENCSFGDAAIIRIGAGGLEQLGQTERAKVLAPLLTEVVDSARRAGYDEKLVQGFVTIGVQLWLIENSQTGERMFVDPAEYQFLFGEAPAPGTPALASVPQSVMDMPVIAPAAGSEEGRPSGLRRGRAVRKQMPVGGTDGPPAMTSDANTGTKDASAPSGSDAEYQPAEAMTEKPEPFVPASEQLGKGLVDEVSNALVERSSRRLLSKADVGKWKVIEYTSDGNTVYTMKTGQMERYGLLAERVNNEEQLRSFFGATTVRVLEPQWSESLVRVLTSRWMQGLLIVIFLISLFLEMTHPGLILPGTVAGLALLCLVGPPILIGAAGWWHVIAIVAGILLLLVEVLLLPGMLAPGLIGVLLLFGGLLAALMPGGARGMFPGESSSAAVLYPAAMLAGSTLVAGIAIFFITKHLPSLPLFGRLVIQNDFTGRTALAGGNTGAAGATATHELLSDGSLEIGAVGVATTPLRPAGKVMFGDRVVDVLSSEGFVAAGTRVRLIEAERMRLVVQPMLGRGDNAGTGNTQGGVG